MPDNNNLPSASRMAQNGDIAILIGGFDIRNCCTDISFSGNENVQNIMFLSDNGYGSSWVAGMQHKITGTGKYVTGDSFCELLAEKEHAIGTDRITTYSITKFGTTITGSCTLENITIGGGGAIDGAAISFTAAFNGAPTAGSGGSGGG